MYKKILFGAMAFFVIAQSISFGQVRNRWKLEFKHTPPELYIYRDPLGNRTPYWYVAFEIYNNAAVNMNEAVPIQVDVMLHTEYGKDYLADLQKIGLEGTRSGKYYSNVVHFEVEQKIIEKITHIGNRSKGIIRENIEYFKKNNMYLNPRELRNRRFIKPGETISCIAIFTNVDPRANILEIQVSGLVDILKIKKIEAESVEMELENRVLKIKYDLPGDPFHKASSTPIYAGKKWDVKQIGPIASKETLELLVNTFVEALECQEGKEPKKREITPLDLRIANNILKRATGKDFGYDVSKGIKENELAVWKWHEWWISNKGRLYYDEKTNKFEVYEISPQNK